MGWIKIDRQLFEHYLWTEKPFSKGQAWVDLIGLANFQDEKTMYMGQVVLCKRGTVHRSFSYLARRWGWSRDKVTRFLRALESDSMVRIKSTTHHTTITIENYDVFQNPPATDKATNKATSRQQADKEKRNIKKDKEDKENRAAPSLPEEAGLPTDEPGNPWPDDIWED